MPSGKNVQNQGLRPWRAKGEYFVAKKLKKRLLVKTPDPNWRAVQKRRRRVDRAAEVKAMSAAGFVPKARKAFVIYAMEKGILRDFKAAGIAWKRLPDAEKLAYRAKSKEEFDLRREAVQRGCGFGRPPTDGPPRTRGREPCAVADGPCPGAGETAPGDAARVESGVFEWCPAPENLLGKGSYGSVFTARTIAGGAKLAVKMYHEPDEQGRELEFLRRFQHQGGAAAGPFLQVLGQTGTAPINAIFIELCDYSLAHALRKNPSEGPLEAPLHVFHQVREALRILHSQGVCHCDVKPANILWVSRKRRAVLCDFSLAKDMALSPQTDMACTANYRPPECFAARGSFHVLPSIDTWSFGCTLWELGHHGAKANPERGRGAVLFPGLRSCDVVRAQQAFFDSGRSRGLQAHSFADAVLMYCSRLASQRCLMGPLVQAP